MYKIKRFTKEDRDKHRLIKDIAVGTGATIGATETGLRAYDAYRLKRSGDIHKSMAKNNYKLAKGLMNDARFTKNKLINAVDDPTFAEYIRKRMNRQVKLAKDYHKLGLEYAEGAKKYHKAAKNQKLKALGIGGLTAVGTGLYLKNRNKNKNKSNDD